MEKTLSYGNFIKSVFVPSKVNSLKRLQLQGQTKKIVLSLCKSLKINNLNGVARTHTPLKRGVGYVSRTAALPHKLQPLPLIIKTKKA